MPKSSVETEEPYIKLNELIKEYLLIRDSLIYFVKYITLPEYQARFVQLAHYVNTGLFPKMVDNAMGYARLGFIEQSITALQKLTDVIQEAPLPAPNINMDNHFNIQ